MTAAATVSAAVFAGMHFYGLSSFLIIFATAMVSAYLFEKSRSIIHAIAAHAANNLLVVLSTFELM